MIETSEVRPRPNVTCLFLLYTNTCTSNTVSFFGQNWRTTRLSNNINYMEAGVRRSIVHYESYLDRPNSSSFRDKNTGHSMTQRDRPTAGSVVVFEELDVLCWLPGRTIDQADTE